MFTLFHKSKPYKRQEKSDNRNQTILDDARRFGYTHSHVIKLVDLEFQHRDADTITALIAQHGAHLYGQALGSSAHFSREFYLYAVLQSDDKDSLKLLRKDILDLADLREVQWAQEAIVRGAEGLAELRTYQATLITP